MKKVEISVILPCFNEGPTFEKNVNTIIAKLKKLKRNWEIVFVEDKSEDKTKDFIERFVKRVKGTRAIYHLENQGRGQTVKDGIMASYGAICGYLDVDLEVSEQYIDLFIKEIESGNDLVVGKRFYEGGLSSLTRVVSSKLYAFAVKSLLDLKVEDTECGYKFFRKSKIVPLLPKIKSKHWFWDTEICAQAFWQNLKISQVPVIFRRRADKRSTVKMIPDSIDYIKNLWRLRATTPN